MGAYEGPVVFVHPHDANGFVAADGTQGVHYPVGDDGHADMSRPLRWDAEAAGYRDAEEGEETHHETFHENHVELTFPDGSTIRVSEDEAEVVRAKLAELRGEKP